METSRASEPKHRQALVLAAGFLLLLQMGAPYAYGVIKPVWQQAFSLSETAASLPYSLILAAYTVGMWVGGRWVDSAPPSKVGAVGALLFGSGFLISAGIGSLWSVLFGFGLVCGFGIGLGYMAAVAAAVAGAPGRKGLATGAVVLGFGLSSAFLAPVLSHLFQTLGWRATFAWAGGLFLLASLPLALTLKMPPNWEPLPPRKAALITGAPFFLLWSGWLVVIAVGVAWLGQMADLARHHRWDEASIPWLVSSMALANGLSRPLVGFAADKVGRPFTLVSASWICASTLLALWLVPSEPLLWAGAVIVGACFGSWMVNMAPLASDWFGQEGMGGAYGQLFTSYGVAALLGPPLIASIRSSSMGEAGALAVSTILLFAAGCLFSLAAKEKNRGQQKEASPAS